MRERERGCVFDSERECLCVCVGNSERLCVLYVRLYVPDIWTLPPPARKILVVVFFSPAQPFLQTKKLKKKEVCTLSFVRTHVNNKQIKLNKIYNK